MPVSELFCSVCGSMLPDAAMCSNGVDIDALLQGENIECPGGHIISEEDTEWIDS